MKLAYDKYFEILRRKEIIQKTFFALLLSDVELLKLKMYEFRINFKKRYCLEQQIIFCREYFAEFLNNCVL